MKSAFRALSVVIFCVTLAACQSQSGSMAEQTETLSFDGMVRQSQDQFDEVYVSPEFSIQDYQSLMLEPGTVAFKKNWARNYNSSGRLTRVTERDMEMIRERMSGYVFSEFEAVLGDNSPMPLVTEVGELTLLVKPSIINLDLNAPDLVTANRQYSYAESAGEATLYLELIDSVSGKPLARVVDRQEDWDDNYFTWRNRATNAQDAKRIARLWAERFVELLEKVGPA
ncbi:DUF3313 family protein [Alteromonas aestuariivivens]|uniref:DUF3313 family protein n=1 Tax=Alteromonas aestuariivivens TaxID=1938339 RepID=A0A3D8M7J3_9ALTE|nr:DUF3313 family protein [Alteromonas aestuariivivens]RDV25524.1 DUF3313 family protein [Alteromonas aestuariivivens]